MRNPAGLGARLDSFKSSIFSRGNLWIRPETSYIVFFFMILLSFAFVLLPLRHLPVVTNLAALSAQAGRSITLASRAIFYSRELALCDGFIAGESIQSQLFSLQNAADELLSVHRAIRGGGDHNIDRGVDRFYSSADSLLFFPVCSDIACRIGDEEFEFATDKGYNFLLRFSALVLNWVKRVSEERLMMITNGNVGGGTASRGREREKKGQKIYISFILDRYRVVPFLFFSTDAF